MLVRVPWDVTFLNENILMKKHAQQSVFLQQYCNVMATVDDFDVQSAVRPCISSVSGNRRDYWSPNSQSWKYELDFFFALCFRWYYLFNWQQIHGLRVSLPTNSCIECGTPVGNDDTNRRIVSGTPTDKIPLLSGKSCQQKKVISIFCK